MNELNNILRWLLTLGKEEAETLPRIVLPEFVVWVLGNQDVLSCTLPAVSSHAHEFQTVNQFNTHYHSYPGFNCINVFSKIFKVISNNS